MSYREISSAGCGVSSIRNSLVPTALSVQSFETITSAQTVPIPSSEVQISWANTSNLTSRARSQGVDNLFLVKGVSIRLPGF